MAWHEFPLQLHLSDENSPLGASQSLPLYERPMGFILCPSADTCTNVHKTLDDETENVINPSSVTLYDDTSPGGQL